MEDTQENADDMLSIIVKEEYDVQEEDVQFVEEGNRRADTFLDTSLDCRECGRTYKNVASLLRHLASCHNDLVPEITDSPDSPSTSTLHTFTIIKKEETDDEMEESPDLMKPPRSSKTTKKPHPGNKKFECDKCGAKLKYPDGFIRHYREIHLGIRNYKCKKCNKTFKRNSGLKKHLETHSKKWLSCEICQKTFKGPTRLRKHIKTHAAFRRFECDKCGVRFLHQFTFMRHYREVHLGARNFKCNQCEKVFKRKSALKNHQKIHLNKSFECHECGNTYRDSWSLLDHFVRHHGGHSLSASTPHSVTIVKKEETDEVEEYPDLMIQSGSSKTTKKPHPGNKKFECDKCGAKLKYPDGFIRHYREIHLGIRNYKCKVCSRTFKRNAALKKHLTTHSGKLLSCEICKKAYKGPTGPIHLRKHIKTHHLKQFQCDICGVILMRQCNLKRHYREIHVGIENYRCNICEKIFIRKSGLKTHLKTHRFHSNKPLECHECGKTYRYTRCLLGHLASHGDIVTEIPDSFSTLAPHSVSSGEEILS